MGYYSGYQLSIVKIKRERASKLGRFRKKTQKKFDLRKQDEKSVT